MRANHKTGFILMFLLLLQLLLLWLIIFVFYLLSGKFISKKLESKIAVDRKKFGLKIFLSGWIFFRKKSKRKKFDKFFFLIETF